MEGIDTEVGVAAADSDGFDIPEDIRQEVESLKATLTEEVVVQEKYGEGTAIQSGHVDQRIQDGMDRIKQLRERER